jgi:hypothetical protein
LCLGLRLEVAERIKLGAHHVKRVSRRVPLTKLFLPLHTSGLREN